MVINLFLAFVIPWIVCTFHLFKRDKKLILTIGFFFSVIAFVINELGIYFGYWIVSPFPDQKTLSTLPFNLGLYPILASYMVYFIKKYNYPYLLIILVSIFTTSLETIFVVFGRVTYGNGWTIIWTFLSYLFPYIIVYWYYLVLRKLKILN